MSAFWKAEQVCTEVILSIASLLNLQWTFPNVFGMALKRPLTATV